MNVDNRTRVDSCVASHYVLRSSELGHTFSLYSERSPGFSGALEYWITTCTAQFDMQYSKGIQTRQVFSSHVLFVSIWYDVGISRSNCAKGV